MMIPYPLKIKAYLLQRQAGLFKCCALNQADLPTCLEFFVNGASFATAHLRSTSLPPLLSIRSQGLQDSHAYSEPHWIES
ncbi:hypothetical protein TGRH88_030890 [Toxoplasma gondii]|uniref:Uncharacterized protein n=1 Tax=Toxoplasma gondii TaxID=5811 RepID=A0A7J6K7H9_TOXGO|nr:hypothetical protein TGRH88_030890 [Toxoplasma gondii]